MCWSGLKICRHIVVRADVMIKDSDGDTPLHVCECVDCGKYLLEHGAKYDIPNNQGMTVSFKRVRCHLPPFVKLRHHHDLRSPFGTL